jgi:hypothetical protein
MAPVESFPPHSKPLDWPGWSEHTFALEMQEPWADALMSGKKTIETRTYNLPPSLIGRKICILQTPSGTAQVSSLDNEILLNSSSVRLLGWCIFGRVKQYTSKEDFEDDEPAHLVKRSSWYGWKEGATKAIYGWVVESCDRSIQATYPKASRRMRSLFQLVDEQ